MCTTTVSKAQVLLETLIHDEKPCVIGTMISVADKQFVTFVNENELANPQKNRRKIMEQSVDIEELIVLTNSDQYCAKVRFETYYNSSKVKVFRIEKSVA